jgi:predicted permease
VSDFFQDVRYALRGLVRSPGFTITAVLTLALGIGANTAVFSVVNAVLLRPPAHIAEHDRLASIYTSDFSGPPYGGSSYPDIEDFAAGTPALAEMAAYTMRALVVSDPEAGRQAELATGLVVTPNYFDVLGVPMAIGRPFAGALDASDGVVLGDGFWRTHYGADPSVVGATIRIAGSPLTVIGIAPPGFTGLVPALVPAFYLPLGVAVELEQAGIEERGSRGLVTFGRLADGATLEQARAQLAGVSAELFRLYPEAWTDVSDQPRRVTVIAASEAMLPPQLMGPASAFATVLMAVVGAVLLICCANLANLLLVRATRRQREMGIRLALGAGRARVVRQLVTESMVLAGLGAVAGIAVAYGATRLIATLDLPLPVLSAQADLAPDRTVLGFALLVTLVAGMLFGLAPALAAARPSLTSAIREEKSAGLARRSLGLRGLLAGGQVAVAVLLTVMGALLVRSLMAAQSVDPGFRTEDMLFVTLRHGEVPTLDELTTLNRGLRERTAALPGVRLAGYVNALPLRGADLGRRGYGVEGYTPGETEEMEFNTADAGPGYFEAMGIPLVRGREFTESDGPDAPRVAIVNETFARRYLNGDAVGKRLNPGRPTEAEIVGVVADGKYRTLREEPLPYVYRALDQNGSAGVTLVVHAPGLPPALDDALRAVAGELAPDAAIIDVASSDQYLAQALLPQRAGAVLLGLFGVLGLALAALGIYGVMAYAVSSRTREIGIRLAIGARPGDIVRMVVRQGSKVAAIGAAVGLAAAVGLTPLLEFLLFGVEPLDPVAFAATAAVVGVVTLLANWIPAMRGAAVSAAITMKGD